MGCVTSKQAVSVTLAIDHSEAFRENESGRSRGSEVVVVEKKKRTESSGLSGSELGESGRASSNGYSWGGGESLSFRLGNLQKYVELEQVAAGWPAWLSAVAGEAVHGWVPLSADFFEKLEKARRGRGGYVEFVYDIRRITCV